MGSRTKVRARLPGEDSKKGERRSPWGGVGGEDQARASLGAIMKPIKTPKQIY